MNETYAIYAESDGYVHLVTGMTETQVVNLLIEDIVSVNVNLRDIFNVYAVNGRQENVALENRINKLIAQDQLCNNY